MNRTCEINRDFIMGKQNYTKPLPCIFMTPCQICICVFTSEKILVYQEEYFLLHNEYLLFISLFYHSFSFTIEYERMSVCVCGAAV